MPSKALDALSGGGLGGGYGTNSDTKPPADSTPVSQVSENAGGREGIRTPGLLVANEEKIKLRCGATTI